MDKRNNKEAGTFWEHLDELRFVLMRIVLATVVFGIAAFLFKDTLFTILLAPKNSGFISYRLMEYITGFIPFSEESIDPINIRLISTQLSQQFIIHVKMAMYAGFMLVFPYVLYEIFRFVSPALYDNEKKYAFHVISSGYLMFMSGVALSYFLIFPLTFRFLGGTIYLDIRGYLHQ